MDDLLDTRAKELRNMTSSQAADWLIKTYPLDSPTYWEGLPLITHNSWKREDQIRLAQHYLKKLPFASSKPYEIFASHMSFKLFIRVIREQLPVNVSDVQLLLYYLIPVLKSTAKKNADFELIESLISDISSPANS